MNNELEKQFFDTFGIECNISFHQQFNGAQVPRGLEFYKKREELAKTGIIKIWHKMLNPRPENDCVYWGEYHYPQITDRILLELEAIIHNEYNILVYEKFMDSIKITAYPMDDNLPCDPAYFTVMAQADNKREALLVLAMDINVQHYIKQQVQALFEEG